MIRAGVAGPADADRKPRASGDDPRVVGADGDLGVVNPARAGMIPRKEPNNEPDPRKPRASGDDPDTAVLYPADGG